MTDGQGGGYRPDFNDAEAERRIVEGIARDLEPDPNLANLTDDDLMLRIKLAAEETIQDKATWMATKERRNRLIHEAFLVRGIDGYVIKQASGMSVMTMRNVTLKSALGVVADGRLAAARALRDAREV